MCPSLKTLLFSLETFLKAKSEKVQLFPSKLTGPQNKVQEYLQEYKKNPAPTKAKFIISYTNQKLPGIYLQLIQCYVSLISQLKNYQAYKEVGKLKLLL